MVRRATLGLLAGLLLLPAAVGAKPPSPGATVPVEVSAGAARLSASVDGRAALLVPVRYPIQLAGHSVRTRVRLTAPGGIDRRWTLRVRTSAGAIRQPEPRRAFTFVHRIELGPRLTREARRGAHVRVVAAGGLDANRDGIAELRSGDRRSALLRPAPRRRRLCSSLPRLQADPGAEVTVALPVCTSAVRWRIDGRPEDGTARIRGSRLVFSAGRAFRGTESVLLAAADTATASAEAGEPLTAALQVVVGTGGGAVVRAIGDSVTAGFGYYSNGTTMPFDELLSCRPGETSFNDACSSNSTNTSNKGSVVNYAPDYGLANNVSWVAQWANEHGVTNYENLAVSGSEPTDWAPGGQFYATTKEVEAEEPDYVLMTVGANPLLSDMLFGLSDIGCGIYSDVFGGFRECIERAFGEVNLRANLKNLYVELVNNTRATIYLMGYPVSIPSVAIGYSATQLAMTGRLLNREIASVAGEVSETRLQPILPPHFAVGTDIAPVYPARYSCSRLGFKVDGPSVQSEPSQDELEVDHPLSFCSGPETGPPWVISGDTGIHPSAAGYTQMASQVPAPEAP